VNRAKAVYQKVAAKNYFVASSCIVLQKKIIFPLAGPVAISILQHQGTKCCIVPQEATKLAKTVASGSFVWLIFAGLTQPRSNATAVCSVRMQVCGLMQHFDAFVRKGAGYEEEGYCWLEENAKDSCYLRLRNWLSILPCNAGRSGFLL